MRKFFTFLFFLLFSCSLHCEQTLKGIFTQAKKGDFFIADQGGTLSLILIREASLQHLIVEEIVAQINKSDLKKIDWKTWVREGAPGALSWTAMTFNLETHQLTQCFSFFEKQWIFLEESDKFVRELFTLSFEPTRKKDRKKIGPMPDPKAVDRRRLWKPQLIRDGKRVEGAEFSVIRAKWPLDKSKLAGSIIELYFDAQNPEFPFPYWMEVQHPHFTFKFRTIDSGKGIASPMPLLQIKSNNKKGVMNKP